MDERTRASGDRRRHGPAGPLLLAGALAVALAIPAAAFAGKGGGSSTTAWIALGSVSGAVLAQAQPAYGSTVHFATGYATTTKNPWVSLTCYQGATLVYAEGNAPSADFSLGGGGSVWSQVGGGAACRAELGDLYMRGGRQYYTYLAHTTFEAAP